MDFLIADTSTYSLARLSSDEPKSVKVTREALLWLLPARSQRLLCAVLPIRLGTPSGREADGGHLDSARVPAAKKNGEIVVATIPLS